MASDSDSDSENGSETVYCICREPYDGERFMIECDVCKDWFHGSCIGVKEHQAVDIEIYHCPKCQHTHGPLVLKKKRQKRTDYSEESSMAKAFQTGTLPFVNELKNRTFPSADEIIVQKRDGYGLTLSYFEENGFTVPILINDKSGLNLKIPPANFSIQDVENYVGSLHEIDVIDVARQEDYRMLMREWTEYYNSTERKKILNVISLEFSKTRLTEIVEPPKIVREMSWVDNFWPKEAKKEDSKDDQAVHEKPCVQRYCLMSVKDSYTDFHIDFGGTSVWYHVLRGEKLFYLIEPTSANLQLYETWLNSSHQSKMFFGDQVEKCYACTVKQAQTLFIPTGWIHAVVTPKDSLVFGGNFLHNFNIEQQIQVYELEKRVHTPGRYMYPNYEALHWYAAKHIHQEITEFLDNDEPLPPYLVSGANCLIDALRSWTHKRDYIKRDNIPDSIQYGKLLRDLQKQLKDISKPTPSLPSSVVLAKRKLESDTECADSKEIKLEDTEDSSNEEINVTDYDVKYETQETTQDRKPPFLKPHKIPPYQVPKLHSPHKENTFPLDSSAFFKTATTGDRGLHEPHTDCRPEMSREYTKVEGEGKDHVQPSFTSHFSKTSTSPGQVTSSYLKTSSDTDPDSEDDALVVEESPHKSLKRKLYASPASLKIKLSGDKLFSENKWSSFLPDHTYTTKTEQKREKPTPSKASASMQDAIQGMLSMSRTLPSQAMSSLQKSPFNLDKEQSPATVRLERTKRYQMTGEHRLSTAYKDDQFIYPSLEGSDNEDDVPVFKRKGKVQKDLTWNPKAKVKPNTPAMERPARPFARREAVESQLEDAAIKLAHKPMPKRQYTKRNVKCSSGSLSNVSRGYMGFASSSHTVNHYSDGSLEICSEKPSLQMNKSKQKTVKKKGLTTVKQRLGKILKLH